MISETRASRRGRPLAIVTGAAGQDGSYLVQSLVGDGYVVHGTVRPGRSLRSRVARDRLSGVVVHELDLLDGHGHSELIADLKPDELYNLAGQSSVAASFGDPDATWATNAHAVEILLEAVRKHSPLTRFYQSSSSEMFGSAGADRACAEDSPLLPESPYAAAKAAAHLLCGAYRRAFDLRVACGILFNHESSRRPSTFLTRKVVDHVGAIRQASPSRVIRMQPLAMGNLAARRDWGFAPEYVAGMRLIARQIEVRRDVLAVSGEHDEGANYRDYVLGTGRLHAVWELIDRAFSLVGLPLDWDLSGDASSWSAAFRGTTRSAVVVDPTLLRPSDPGAIAANASRARGELGWAPSEGLDPILAEMLHLGAHEWPVAESPVLGPD